MKRQRYVLRCKLCRLRFADSMRLEQVQTHFRVVHDEPGTAVRLELYDTWLDRVVERS
jgi:hypothetical protein